MQPRGTASVCCKTTTMTYLAKETNFQVQLQGTQPPQPEMCTLPQQGGGATQTPVHTWLGKHHLPGQAVAHKHCQHTLRLTCKSLATTHRLQTHSPTHPRQATNTMRPQRGKLAIHGLTASARCDTAQIGTEHARNPTSISAFPSNTAHTTPA